MSHREQERTLEHEMPWRLPVDLSQSRLEVLVAVMLLAAVPASAQEDPVRNELGTTVEEPVVKPVEVPEGRKDKDGGSPFRTASSGKVLWNDSLATLVQEAVDVTQARLLDTAQHTPWQIMHGQLGLRRNYEIRHNGQVIKAIDWISEGPAFENEMWFEKTRHGGRAHPYSRPWAFEGHANQFLAILSMSGLDLEHQFGTDSGTITMKDMLRHAQMTVNSREEVTWTLWALSRYLPPDASWRNERGEPWSIEKLVQIETGKQLKGAPCGGTHGLFALAHARNVYLRTGKPLRGVWAEADYKIRKYINTARLQQNSNGSLSSDFFRGRAFDQDFNERMASAGHLLEFLMMAVSESELKSTWVRRAVESAARDLLANRKAYVKCSPLYHSVNALNIYLDRVRSESQIAEVASRPDGLRPAGDGEVALQKVPAISISQGRDLATEDAAAPASPQGTSAETGNKSMVAESEPEVSDKPVTESPTAPEAPAEQSDAPAQSAPSTEEPVPATSSPGPEREGTDPVLVPVPLLSEKSESEGTARSVETWRSTPDGRRTPLKAAVLIPSGTAESDSKSQTAPTGSTVTGSKARKPISI